MAYDFRNVVSPTDLNNLMLQHFGAKLTPEQIKHLKYIQENWNFYRGYHWQDIPDTGKPQITENYCRTFVNKFVSFELGKGFKTKMLPEIEKIEGDNDPLDFLADVWKYNDKSKFCIEFAQSKSVTGDAWVQVAYQPKYLNGQLNPEFVDPFDEYEKGKIRVIVVPTSVCFPEYSNGYDKDRLMKLTIMYPIPLDANKTRMQMYRQVWTDSFIEVWEGETRTLRIPNKYKFIPFKQVKNIPLVGETEGTSDLDDIIPLNMEINLKRSDVSEIIDYHSAPITIVFGARIGQLERGANKVWGGLPKDAKVENLKLDGDLAAANNHIEAIKAAMFMIANIPQGAMGGDMAISNTSALALQLMFAPLIERIDMKRTTTKEGLEWINKAILFIAVKEGLINIPDGVKPKDFYFNEVHFEQVLPKDLVYELQQIQIEMSLGLENREGAMERLGKEDIQYKIEQIDKDRKENHGIYGLDKDGNPIGKGAQNPGQNKDGQTKTTNAGYQNGPQGTKPPKPNQ